MQSNKNYSDEYFKRPISDTALRINSTLFMVVATSLTKDDPAFDGLLQDSYEYYTVENGIAKSIAEAETADGLDVVLKLVDGEGNERAELPQSKLQRKFSFLTTRWMKHSNLVYGVMTKNWLMNFVLKRIVQLKLA